MSNTLQFKKKEAFGGDGYVCHLGCGDGFKGIILYTSNKCNFLYINCTSIRHLKILIGRQLLYNVVLVSVIQQCESKYTYVPSFFSLFFTPHPILLF